MKHLFLLILLCLLKMPVAAQSYEYGLIYNGNNQFSVLATPNFTGNTDISDIGFTLTLPTGNLNLSNLSLFNSRSWIVSKITAQQLTDSYSLGDNTKDYFVLNIEPGQTILSHTANIPFLLVTFNIDNIPNGSEIAFLANDNTVALGLNEAFNSFYNSNIDNTTTKDYFGGLSLGQESVIIGTLGTGTEVPYSDLSVYPNPSSHFISINTKLTVKKVVFYDVAGKLVFSSSETLNIPILHLTNGIYFLKIIAENTTIIKKIVKN